MRFFFAYPLGEGGDVWPAVSDLMPMSLFRADSDPRIFSPAKPKFEFNMEVAMSHKSVFSFVLVLVCLIALPQQFLWAGNAPPISRCSRDAHRRSR